MRVIVVTAMVFSIGALTAGQQIRRPELEKNQGIEECVKGSRRRKNYGYGELVAAGVYESDEETPVKMGTKVSSEVNLVKISSHSLSLSVSARQGGIGVQGGH